MDFPVDCGVASVIALMAGSVGEEIILGGYSLGGRGDWAQASEWLEYLGYDDDGAAALWDYTASLMAGHRGAIMRLARALMDARSLSGDEIDALLAE